MRRRVGLVGLIAIAGLAAAPALADPVCGETAAMSRLQTDLAQPRGVLLIAAHRAGHLDAPENSLAAVDEAVREGADIVELDVKVSADGVPFLMHDRTVTRTTGGVGEAESLTHGQLRDLRLANSAEPPPTLVEALRRTCGRVLVDLDMKTDRVAAVVAVVEGLGMTDQVVFFDSDGEVLRAVRRLLPRAHVMPHVSRPDGLGAALVGLPDVPIVHGDPDSLTPDLRRGVRGLPARIWVNSLGEVDHAVASGAPDICARLEGLLGLDANVIQTDRPRALRRAVTDCGLSARP
ncbi:glycerophosphodiester phosphodiesterase family protein [Brevundimonas aurantiaca]|uniref:glycerophosphodiester phosphodiesterase family protein n=1 Tax=Brevundimonas aurantiaca TaxID=74316 RepID=UPI00174BB443|nr:glycerophosphodiester phosphodiesterase family protein [Brevundimonas aurantiaca]